MPIALRPQIHLTVAVGKDLDRVVAKPLMRRMLILEP